jgi:hypothetical protein
MIQAELLLNSRPVQGNVGAAGALASVSVAAVDGVRHFILGIEADYSAAVASIKTVTVKINAAAVFVYRWDFSKGPFVRNLPAPWHGDYKQAVSVELEGTGAAETGRVGITVASL